MIQKQYFIQIIFFFQQVQSWFWFKIFDTDFVVCLVLNLTLGSLWNFSLRADLICNENHLWMYSLNLVTGVL